MSRYGSGFREPPWVMGSPKEVMDWVEASHPRKEEKEKHRFEKEFLNNLHIRFDFDVDHKLIKSSCVFCRLARLNKIQENFELLPTVELILRGLAKAKFKNTAKIVVDGKVIYKHPEKKTDIRNTIENISDFSKEISQGNTVEITALLDDIEKSTAIIKIKRVHKEKEHSVDIQIKGKIRINIYHTFINYLEEKIGLVED